MALDIGTTRAGFKGRRSAMSHNPLFRLGADKSRAVDPSQHSERKWPNTSTR